jgi:hypothetical protein
MVTVFVQLRRRIIRSPRGTNSGNDLCATAFPHYPQIAFNCTKTVTARRALGSRMYLEHAALHKKRYLWRPHVPDKPSFSRLSLNFTLMGYKQWGCTNSVTSGRARHGPSCPDRCTIIVTSDLSANRPHKKRCLPGHSAICTISVTRRRPTKKEWQVPSHRITSDPLQSIRHIQTSRAHKPLPSATAFAQKSLPHQVLRVSE